MVARRGRVDLNLWVRLRPDIRVCRGAQMSDWSL